MVLGNNATAMLFPDKKLFKLSIGIANKIKSVLKYKNNLLIVSKKVNLMSRKLL
jgi:hypothetical protein